MALVIMRERLCLAPLERQARLGTIQRLYLVLLVHTQHDGFFRRVEIEPHDIHELVAKVRVIRHLEASHLMRLESCRLSRWHPPWQPTRPPAAPSCACSSASHPQDDPSSLTSEFHQSSIEVAARFQAYESCPCAALQYRPRQSAAASVSMSDSLSSTAAQSRCWAPDRP